MPENNNIELRSEEVQEILGHIPSWIVRWGITLFFIILVVLLTGSYFFAYPDVVQGDIEILSENPPVEIKARVSGQIDSLCVSDTSYANQGDLIAVIKNPARFEDVKKAISLVEDAKRLKLLAAYHDIDIPSEIPTLGTMQVTWAQLIASLKEYNLFVEEKYYETKIQQLRLKTGQQKKYILNLKKQITLTRQSLNLTVDQYGKDSMLFGKGVISQLDLDNSKQSVLQQKGALETKKAALTQSNMQITALQEQLTDYTNSLSKEKKQLERNIEKNLEGLTSAIDTWKESYLIIAPKEGKVSFTGIWSSKQPVIAGDVVCTIVPVNSGNIVGRIKLNLAGAGKIEKDQRVNIKLMDYPYMEFGMIEAKVKNVALIPNEEFYWAYVDVTDTLVTTYGKEIHFRQRMPGTAEIITKDLSVLDRFLQPIMSAIYNR